MNITTDFIDRLIDYLNERKMLLEGAVFRVPKGTKIPVEVYHYARARNIIIQVDIDDPITFTMEAGFL